MEDILLSFRAWNSQIIWCCDGETVEIEQFEPETRKPLYLMVVVPFSQALNEFNRDVVMIT